MQQLSFYTHVHIHSRVQDFWVLPFLRLPDALSPCHSLGSQPGGRSLEQAWGWNQRPCCAMVLPTLSISPA